MTRSSKAGRSEHGSPPGRPVKKDSDSAANPIATLSTPMRSQLHMARFLRKRSMVWSGLVESKGWSKPRADRSEVRDQESEVRSRGSGVNRQRSSFELRPSVEDRI